MVHFCSIYNIQNIKNYIAIESYLSTDLQNNIQDLPFSFVGKSKSGVLIYYMNLLNSIEICGTLLQPVETSTYKKTI